MQPEGELVGPIGGIAGATYTLASTALHSGGSLTQAQNGLFGSTGNGVLTVNLGTMSAPESGRRKKAGDSPAF